MADSTPPQTHTSPLPTVPDTRTQVCTVQPASRAETPEGSHHLSGLLSGSDACTLTLHGELRPPKFTEKRKRVTFFVLHHFDPGQNF